MILNKAGGGGAARRVLVGVWVFGLIGGGGGEGCRVAHDIEQGGVGACCKTCVAACVCVWIDREWRRKVEREGRVRAGGLGLGFDCVLGSWHAGLAKYAASPNKNILFIICLY